KLAEDVSNSYIDNLYNTALKNGAEGGKLMGAGGSGFLLFFADPDKHKKIIDALPGLKVEQFNFEPEGSKVIYEQGEPCVD
ncbi:MAG: kinase, partial [Candidatus Micrarchaeota archaeon]|nr:kinase [Candidatus Micrarchaeota archaeon]